MLARRGEIDEAVALARDAAAIVKDSDSITHRAKILVNVAEVLRAQGDLAGAAEALTEAVALHEEKGNVLNAQQCRELLASVATAAR